MTDDVATRQFSTALLPPPQGADSWRRYMAAAYDDLDIVPADSWRAGRIREVAVGSIGVSIVGVDAQKVVRRKDAVPAGSEDYLIVLPTRGALQVKQGREPTVVEPGDACLLNAAEHYVGWMPDASANVAFKLPAHLLRARLGALDDACGRARVVDPELIPIVRRFAAGLFGLARSGTAKRLEDACLGLLTALFDGSPDQGERGRSTVSDLLATEVRAHLDRHLGDPALTIGAVASALGVSVRLIQGVMQRSGTTYSETLMAARLDRARHLLQTRASDRRSIAQIAFACGFVSQGHFSVRFRRRFGFSPSDAGPASCPPPNVRCSW